jgi:signal transduction histidine kinase/CHASE3 domain sensor protein
MEEVRLIRKSIHIMETSQLVLSTIKDAEIGHRGFQLTRDTIYLKPYISAATLLPEQLKVLEDLVKNNPVQSKNVDSLHVLIKNQFLIISSILTNVQRSTLYMDRFESLLLTRGRENMDAIRVVVKNIVDNEQRIFQTRVDSESDYKIWTPLALLVYTFIALVAVTILFTRIVKALKKSEIAEKLLSENVKELKTEVGIRKFAQTTIKNILDNSLVGIMAFKSVRNEAGVIEDFEWVLANDISTKLTGKTQQELIGKKLKQVTFEVANDLFTVYKEVVETGVSKQFEKEFKSHEDSKWYYVTVVKLEDGFVATFSDITTQKLQLVLIEEREVLLKEAEALAQMGSWRWTENSNALVWSDGLYKVFDKHKNEDITWNSFLENVHPEDRLLLEDFFHEAKTKKNSLSVDYRIIKDNHVHYLSLTVKPQNIHTIDILGAVIDITQRKGYEKQLEQYNQELKRSNEDLEQFAYVASHDLQEPLRKIRAFGDRLSAKFSEQLGGHGADYILRMQSAAARMQSLIEDLLSFSRVSRQEAEYKLLDSTTILKEVWDDLEAQVKREDASIGIGIIPLFYGDKSQIKRLFQNLITNAIKFHRPNVKPVIEVRGSVMSRVEIATELGINLPNERFIRISVKDNGIGFDKQYTEKIFNIFQRLNGRTAYEGTGIGLAICRKIIANHNGYITAKSVEGVGSEFIVILQKDLI